MKQKNLKIISIIILIAGCIFLAKEYFSYETQMLIHLYGPPDYMKVDGSKPLKEQTRLVQLGDRQFAIPLMYIDSRLGKDLVQRGVNLKYISPGFKSVWDLKDKQEYRQLFKDGYVDYMLISPQSRFVINIDQSAENLLKSYTEARDDGYEYGLKKYLGYRLKVDQKFLYDEFYLEEDEHKNVIGYIMCDPDERVPKPGCSHNFVDKGIRYHINYNKKNFFKEWRSQKQNTITFIDSFEVKSEVTHKGD